MERFQFQDGKDLPLTDLTIQGPRIVLTSICEANAEDIFQHFNASVTRYMMPKPAECIEDTLQFISQSVAAMLAKQELVLVISHQETGAFLGCCGFHGRGQYRTPELGIWLKEAAHGHRYGFEAIQVLCAWAIQHVDFDAAIYPVSKVNIASRKIPERLGGQVVAEKVIVSMSGFLLDKVVYSIPYSVLIETTHAAK
ncbi:GNAT family N-acetyltransferase [Photobacterium sp. GJ3]|uniref:GNAT family N-acetyltransferase n=1 Tax=Photobacterium sp. GJ3 TaxID=2829502 RepID=UPI001B8C905E|nr:GNAT family N-acetyltransferase [Photobacterium sp. GJ3]QUJ66293.1 GNAT family N-acetyltransferase [Photobacterium sp. GJ3]